jgi:hypothetical protein
MSKAGSANDPEVDANLAIIRIASAVGLWSRRRDFAEENAARSLRIAWRFHELNDHDLGRNVEVLDQNVGRLPGDLSFLFDAATRRHKYKLRACIPLWL